MAYKPRTTKPEKGNKYYNTKSNGGYSDAIKGKPTDKDCDVLSNCVGYAYGRFNEIGDYGKMKYLAPVNAENFWDYSAGLQKGQTPKLGACMVWQRGATRKPSDGAGHVCIVEKVISATEVVTSESGWNNPTPWYSKTRKKGSNGRWGQDSNYTFLGFIYNPAVKDEDQPVDYDARIREFQSWMNKEYGYNLVIDGHAGKNTMTTAIKVLQTEMNKRGESLVIDGKYGPATQNALAKRPVVKGTKGAMAYLVQGLLYSNMCDAKGFDGSIGSGADTAIRTFQKAKKLVVDGKVGAATFGKLVGK